MKRSKLPSIILCYHRIGEESKGSLSDLCTSAAHFLEHVDFLRRKGYDFVSLDNFSSTEKGLCAITFDDGYRDNLTHLVPLIRNQNLPVTVFVTSFYVSKQKRFLPDLLCAMNEDKKSKVQVHHRQLAELSRQNTSDFYSNYEDVSSCKSVCSDGVPLSEEELVSLSKTPGIKVGPHTVTHRNLAQISEDEAEEEIVESIAFLRNLGISTSAFFAVPFGQGPHLNEAVSQKIRNLGYEPLTTFPIIPAAAKRCKQGLLGLPRLSVGPWNIAVFRRNLYLVFLGSALPGMWLTALRFRQYIIRIRSWKPQISL